MHSQGLRTPDGPVTAPVTCRYLDAGGEDLAGSEPVFVALNLGTRQLIAYRSEDSAPGTAPVLVGASWVLRWPIPPLDNDRTNELLDALHPYAELLAGQARINVDELGVTFERGAGTCVDTIQRKCADLWRQFYERGPGSERLAEPG